MKLLVLTGDGNEAGYPAIQAFLNQIGIPYDAFVMKGNSLPALNDATKGFYQGIILATGNLAVCCNATGGYYSALDSSGWAALDAYTSSYGVRTVSYYTFPDPRYGLTWTGAATTTGSIAFSPNATAAAVFSYLNRSNAIPLSNAYTYLANPIAALGETTTPILSMAGSTVAVTHTDAYGREYLAATFDNNPYLLHSLALNYAFLNWMTKGIFLGSRKIYLSPQVDDIFLSNDLFTRAVAGCAPPGFLIDPTVDLTVNCPTLRIAGSDLQTIANWQSGIRAKTQTAQFKVTMAFNGFGSTSQGGAPQNDTLTTAAQSYASTFFWVNHTYDHENLNCYDAVPNSGVCTPATYTQSVDEIQKNVSRAKNLGLSLDGSSMVTPEISGLTNPAFMQAAVDKRILYLIMDATQMPPGTPPNTGYFNLYQPTVLQIPRRATNIFYNTSTDLTSATGSEPNEFNYFYGPSGKFPAFTVDQSYKDVINHESDIMLANMLRYEVYPSMFHQANMWAFQNNSSLLSDTIDSTLSKFQQLCNLPISSLAQSSIGNVVSDRMTYNASGVTATLTPGSSITFSVAKAATIPVTGVCSGTCETYGGQRLSRVAVKPGRPVTIAVQ